MWGTSLLVSIPGSQIGALKLPGSIFAWRHLRDAVLTPELRLALRLIMSDAAHRRVRVRFVARPEIFTNGTSRAWLDRRVGDTRDHLAITDGQALRTIPGLHNHVFFAARGLTAAEHALRRLVTVMPEVFAGLAGQVNGALSFRLGARWIRTPTVALRFAATPVQEPPSRLPFVCHPGQVERAAAALAEAAVEPHAAPPDPRPLHYVPLSETALSDPPFVAALARHLQRAALGDMPAVPLLGLPRLDRTEQELHDQVAAVLYALAGTGTVFPRAPCWSIRFTTAPPAPEELAGGRITLHPGTAFWRFGTDLFAAVETVTVAGSGSLAPFRDTLAAWLGREVTVSRPGREPGRTPVTLGNLP